MIIRYKSNSKSHFWRNDIHFGNGFDCKTQKRLGVYNTIKCLINGRGRYTIIEVNVTLFKL